jgi:hypothetical protein
MAQPVPTRAHEVLKLNHPIPQGSESLEVLYVMRPKGKDMARMPMAMNQPGAELGLLHPFAAGLCGLTVRELEELEQDDYMRVMGLVGGWLQEFPQIGPAASSASADTPTGG